MPHVIERAATGRARCRGCEKAIAAGDLRFGERRPNPYTEDGGETTHWFHLVCAALTRPEPFLEAIDSSDADVARREWLKHEARLGTAHRRVPRVRGVERAASGRAACRSCRQPIAKDAWRISLVYYEEGRFAPSGFIHVTCAAAYCETTDLIERLKHFSPELSERDLVELARDLGHEVGVRHPDK
jgi:hypothetical protein